MALKRKRSSNFSPVSDASSCASSSPAPIPFSLQPDQSTAPSYSAFDRPFTWPPQPTHDNEVSWHLGSRTRKRHRDDRPDEADVH
ncbi:hypothetical protein LTR66_008800, partial [Elasticomyces elasticus]